MPEIPRDRSPDSTLALLFEGYRFIRVRCERHQTDVFRTRLLFTPVICMRGAAAARVFYDEARFERRDATPNRLKETVFGKGAVQELDDADHRHRKAMFTSLLNATSVGRLLDFTEQHWQRAIGKWQDAEQVSLLTGAEEIHSRAVCRWANIPLNEPEVGRRTRDFTRMVIGAGKIGLPHWRGRSARRRAERWLTELVQRVRAGRMQPERHSAMHVIAWHRDRSGTVLKPELAAVELLNVLRPTVAVARYVAFLAHALHQHPEYAARLSANDGFDELFVHEVRRVYPFFPFASARVRQDFEWQGYRFPAGMRVLLDLYGTNHDERLWTAPDEFHPERFQTPGREAFGFIPQGGGDVSAGHRCPGENVTVALMKLALRMLTQEMTYEVPPQNLRISLSRMPAAPARGFIIRNVQRRDRETMTSHRTEGARS